MSGSLILTPSDALAGDKFGSSVAFSADGLTAIVGGMSDDVGANVDQGSARVFVWNGTSWVQRGGALIATNGGAYDYFGRAVSLSADGLTAIVSGYGSGVRGDAGAAWVFTWNGTTWVQKGTPLTPTDGAASDNYGIRFGDSVQLSADGSVAIVGASGERVNGNVWQGAARVFVWTGSSWVRRGGFVTAPDGSAHDYWGSQAAISQDGMTALVTGAGDDIGGVSNQGSARVFTWNGTAWIPRGGTIVAADGATDDYFGMASALSADGLTVVIGSRLDNVSSATDQGSARVFDWNGSAWVQRGNLLTPADGAAGDQFGQSVAISSDRNVVIVGGSGDDVSGRADQGSARVFVWDGTSWNQRGGALTPTDGAAGDGFGSAVSISADGLTAIVGGPNDDVGSRADQGSARIFAWNGTAWIEGAPAAAVLAIAATSAVKLEGNTDSTAFTFTVTRTGSLTQASTVNWAVTGSGTNQANAADFVGNVLPSDIVTFAAGETSKTITVYAVADTTAEFDEGFAVTLSGPSAGTTIGTATASGVIQNDDAAASGVFNGHRYEVIVSDVAISWSDARDRSANMGGYLACVTSSQENAFIYDLARTVDSAWFVTTGPWLGGYQPPGSPEPNGGWTWVSGEEFIFTSWNPSEPSNGSGIQDFLSYWNNPYQWDDTTTGEVRSYVVEFLHPPATLSVVATSATNLEGHTGTTPFTFTVTRTGDASSAVTVDWTTVGAGLNPTTADDFKNSVLPSGTLSFAAGETSKTITIDVNGDNQAENDESFTVTLSNPSDGAELGTASANGVIQNDDALIALATPSVSKSEAHAGSVSFSYTVTRAGNLNHASSATWTVTGSGTSKADGSDFIGGVLPMGIVSFGTGEASKTITVNVAGDSTVEANEGFTLTLSNPSTGSSLGASTATGTIVNDDARLDIAATSASKLEGNSGSTPFTFTVTRSGFVTQASTVNWAVAGGTVSGTLPAVGTDFAGGVLPSGVVTFNPGEVTKLITVQVAGDSVQELNESFAVKLSGPSIGTTIGTASAQGVILNDDASLTLTATSATKPEGNTGTTNYTFTVTRAGYLTQATTANWSVAGSGANPANAGDFVGSVLPSGTVSFASGATISVITVAVAGDSIYEADQGFTVTLSTPSAGAAVTQATAAGLIQNDDARLDIAATSASKLEGNTGTTPFTFTVTRIGNTSQASTANWAVAGTGANPVVASDFANGVLPTGTVSFASGETSKTITIQANGDSAYENNETFSVTLSGASLGTSLGTATATGTILNDDSGLSIAATNAVRAEAQSGFTDYTFTVTRSGNTSQASTANWAVTGSGSAPATASDFENALLPSGTVSFAAGDTSKTITVRVAGENLVEQDEGFTVTLSNPSVGSSLTTATASGVILNDDSSVSIAGTNSSQREGNTGTTPYTFTVTRTGYLGVPQTVVLGVAGGTVSGTMPTNAADFAGGIIPTAQALSFAAGETSKQIKVNIAGDSVHETNESFAVTLSNPSTGLSLGTAVAQGIVLNDDARLSIAATSAAKAEGNSGTTAFTFTVTRSGYLTQSSTATWSVTGTGINAANAADFAGGVLPTGSVSFASGETSKVITVNVAGDSRVELAEQFTVTLSAPSVGSAIGTASATGTIQADDVATANTDVIEGGGGVDTLNGLAGNDTITGGGGADRLTGGLGADLFRYLQVSDAPYFLLRMETIRDFNAAEGDRIDLSAIDAISGTVTNDAFTFLGMADFSTTNASGQLIFDYDDGLNLGALFGSVNANGTPELAILLPGVSSLSASSLVL